MNKDKIEEYVRGAGLPAESMRGLTPADLLAIPIPGTWSIQQIILHLMDSDLIGSDRMKRIIAEENPLLIGYNETLFGKNLFYEKLDASAAADIFAKNREMMGVILRNLPASAFDRAGVHNERGRVSLGYMVEGYVGHLEHHLKFIRQKRQLLGK